MATGKDTTDTSFFWNDGESQYRDSAGRLKNFDQPDVPSVPDEATEDTGTAGDGPTEKLTQPDGDNPQTVVDEPKGNADTKVAEQDMPESGTETEDAQKEE